MLSVGSRLLLIGVVTLAILLSSTALFLPLPNQQSASATFPGQNGKITFERNGEIWVMNPDGSRQIDLNTEGSDPDWSPDSTKIAYIIEEDICDQEIYVINADGSGKRRLTNLPPNCGGPFAPDWSPDGTKIAFRSGGIMVMNADGSGMRELTNNGGAPTWSPDGTKIAFTRETQRENQIWVINAADGSGEEQLTTNGGTSPSWSPDGTKIAFGSFRDGNSEIYIMNADGSEERRLTNNPAADVSPDWGTARPTPPSPTATCEGETATIVGTAGNDNNIVGTPGRDVIAALGGNDRISALGGNDLVCGGGGHDQIDGGAGADRLFGHSGVDNIVGGTGNDFIDGGTGADYLNGYSDNDVLRGSSGDDVLLGSTGNDRLFGMDNNDNLDGGTGTADSGNGGANFDTCVRLDTEISCEA